MDLDDPKALRQLHARIQRRQLDPEDWSTLKVIALAYMEDMRAKGLEHLTLGAPTESDSPDENK